MFFLLFSLALASDHLNLSITSFFDALMDRFDALAKCKWVQKMVVFNGRRMEFISQTGRMVPGNRNSLTNLNAKRIIILKHWRDTGGNRAIRSITNKVEILAIFSAPFGPK